MALVIIQDMNGDYLLIWQVGLGQSIGITPRMCCHKNLLVIKPVILEVPQLSLNLQTVPWQLIFVMIHMKFSQGNHH